MPRLSLWNYRKGNNYKTIDKWTAQHIYMGGTAVLIHKYIGPIVYNKEGNPTMPTEGESNELTIQDLLYLENRDRKYDENVYEIRGTYSVNDQDFDLQQFGFFLPNDVLFLTVHMNETINSIGRKPMAGDVIELPHRREDTLLDPNRPAINKFFVITDVNYSAEGYDPSWWPHLLRLKIEPITNSQEFADILDRKASEDSDMTLREVLSTIDTATKVSDSILEAADKDVPQWNFETAHFWYVPGSEDGESYPWIYAGDGKPVNGAVLLGSGNYFPEDPQPNEYWLRTDYEPPVLFQRQGTCWIRKEEDWRRKWVSAHRVLETFINNKNKATYTDGTVHDEKVAISKAVKPRADV